MKKKTLFRKRLLPAVMAAVMGASLLAGCGNGGSASTGGTAAADGSASTGGTAAADGSTSAGDSADAGSGDPFEFESVSDVTFPLKEKLTLDVFVYASLTGGGTYQDNYVTDWIEEQTNIHLNFVYDVDGDDAKTKLNLVMTDPNNLPDLFLATGWTKTELQNYGQQGLIIPLNDLLEDAPNWNAMNEESPLRKADLVMPDGNIYTYGDNNECFHCRYQNRMYIYMHCTKELIIHTVGSEAQPPMYPVMGISSAMPFPLGSSVFTFFKNSYSSSVVSGILPSFSFSTQGM